MRRHERMHADEIESDVSLVRRLLAEQFPRWAHLPIERFPSEGTANAIYRLGDRMAVRLPNQPGKGAQLDKEHVWLPKLAPHLPLAIPEPLARGAPAEGYSLDWSVYRWLEGENGTLDRLSDPVAAARELAGFIRALQRIDPSAGPVPGPHNFHRGVPHAARDAGTRRAIGSSNGLVDPGAVTAAWETDLHAPAWNGPPRWIHGDLGPGNLLALEGRLHAVIDWGGLGVGDPAGDLLPAWNLFDGPSRDSFREALAVDDDTWARGRGLALSIGIVALPYYLDTNPALVRWARTMIDAVLADHERRAWTR